MASRNASSCRASIFPSHWQAGLLAYERCSGSIQSTIFPFTSSPVSLGVAMTANIPEALMLLCQADGQVVTADRETVLLLNGNKPPEGKTVSEAALLSQFAEKVDCAELVALFESFVTNGQSATWLAVNCGLNKRRLSLRRLNGFQSVPLFAVELTAETVDQTEMVEMGRTTIRLIHDFKNQMGGIKLYAAYLKKRFAANPDVAEGLEIADKIVHTLNEMAENASLVVKLSRPVDLKLNEIQPASLVELAITQLQPKIVERQLKLETEFSEVPTLRLDSQQMLLALSALLARAIEVSPENARLALKLHCSERFVVLSIFDQGEQLTEEQRHSLFSLLTTERMNKSSLNLTLARRIIEAHEGTVAILAAFPTGSEVRMTFEI